MTTKSTGQTFILLLVLFSFFFSSNAQITQFRGPNRDGIFPETGLLKEWPADGPEVLFVTEGLGKTNSSTIATSERIYTTGNIDTLEYLSCMDLNGKVLWQKPYGEVWKNSFPEARCTPTLEGDRIYVLSGMDQMACLNAKTGDEIWSVDLHKEYQSDWDMFGVSESPLLVDDKVIASIGGATAMVIALDKMTGKLIWKSKSLNTKRSNVSPALIEHCGKKYIITASKTHVLSLDTENGEICWDYHYNVLSPKGDNSTIISNIPTYKDSCLWISGGWDAKSTMIRIAPDGRSVTEEFNDRTFDNQNHGVVLVDNFLYGSNFTGRQTGKWICMDWQTGEIKWIGDFHTKGPIISAEGMLYLYEEKRGNMALVKANSKKFEVISSFRVKEGKGPHWARPSIYNGMLLVRHGEVMVAYDVKEKKELISEL
ncbi:PQQ-binding-like beta-propeller repeat protein [Carboxylicivirga marina]|uniref:PQQ-like beta-propeller repeat protein n=1 Tax=Carboxylicivirga marina TaxID=2800988 RepID=A0ABS1HI02_9BACT|nr:PQQ-binding-like beta-propeller repeat protein [Carboxylicivirga marina]MBK3517298.1 PQQ-like beta-propeller repeat protein [Carboxylicivirga marina]